MKNVLLQPLLLVLCLSFLVNVYSVQAQPKASKQIFDYRELKSLLLKHRTTVESILGMKRFTLASSKEKPESTIYVYKKDSDTTQIFVRIRKADGLANEIAWNEISAAIGNLTHDAVYDGFVPVAGNSRYYNRFQNLALLVGYKYAEPSTVPCIIRSTE